MGNAYLKSASLALDPAQSAEYLQKSQAGFAKAIDYNPSYARAYNGLGSLHFLKAQLGEVGEAGCHDDWDWEEVEKSRTNYATALALPEHAKPRAGNVDLYAHLGLGRIDYFEGFCLSDQISPAAWQSAREHHGVVVEKYIADPAPHLRLAVSTAYFDLADMAAHEAAWRHGTDPADPKIDPLVEEATGYYQRALDVLDKLDRKEYLRQAIGIEQMLVWTLCLHGQPEEAMRHLEQFVAQPAVQKALQSPLTEDLPTGCSS